MSTTKNFDLYINGAWVAAADNSRDTITNPANGATVGSVPIANAADALKALQAAKAAQKRWRRTPAQQRANLLLKFCAKIRENAEELARLIVAEQGKLLKVARFEVEVTCSFIEYACTFARHISGDIMPSDNADEQLLIHKVPRGVVVAITAWNFPLALAGRKLGPALVTGNTLVLKPTPAAPLSTLALCDLAKEAGLPDGVLNMITGDVAAGRALTESPLTNMITMTGGTPTGQAIWRSAATNMTHVQLELGGKAPCIVFEDADLDQAVAGALHSRFDNYGQVCTCNERMYVHEDIYDAFMEKFRSKVAELKVGDPSEESTDIGPLTDQATIVRIEQLIKAGADAGAKISMGGARLTGPGYDGGNWFEPTLLEEVT
ncbi:MAG: aldehyde dehydrogenase family protein, partial [Bacteroidota bacterium]